MQNEPDGVASFEDFQKLIFCTARVTEAADHPNADRLLVLQIDLGNETRQIVAGIRGAYAAEDLVERDIVVVKNLAPRTIRGETSHGMLLAVHDPEKGIVLLGTEQAVAPGSQVG